MDLSYRDWARLDRT